MTHFVLWQRLEGALVFLAALALAWWIGADLAWWIGADLAWWLAVLAFFAPDLSFLFYGLGSRVGGFAYNSVHTYGFGAAVLALGLACGLPLLAALGALWLGHCGFDRLLGYGLKSRESFSDTHLGRIGKAK